MALDIGLIRTYVSNKFANSTDIQNRKYPTGKIKYYPEEIEFWTQQIFNSKWDLSLFDSEFDNTYKVNYQQSLSTIQFNDYVGQTFLIDKTKNPRGLYISSISIFTTKEDSVSPVTLDLRPLINGIPGEQIPLSIVTAYPDQTRQSGTLDWLPGASGQSSERLFKFDFPIFLTPGYYCFTLKTTSSTYEVFVSENGKGTLNSSNVVTNPYLGDFIYSGQGESWVIDPTKDLCFVIRQAVFDVGTKNVYLNSKRIDYDFGYDILHFTAATSQVKEVAYISSSSATIRNSNTLNDTNITIFPNSDVIVPSRSTANSVNGVPITLALTNTDPDLTPIIDLEQTGIALINNYIDPYSTAISESELTPNGLAFAKYRTKPVTLNEGFDADGITVYVDVNKPEGTEIEIFYRILNRYDNSIAFADTNWYLMSKKSAAAPALLSSDYVEETYENLNITYTGVNGTFYETFNQLAIKVVFYSNDSTKVPTIKNLRAIATV
jgi:hypothetical protein